MFIRCYQCTSLEFRFISLKIAVFQKSKNQIVLISVPLPSRVGVTEIFPGLIYFCYLVYCNLNSFSSKQ